MLVPIRKALLSVYDKEGIVLFAKTLQEHGVKIISTGGTQKKLIENGIEVLDISTITKFSEAFGGRMKTISFEIESALLFDRVKDQVEADHFGIKPIDLVVCNFYPFEKVLENNVDDQVLIENIDIGGPTMVRAAAKNYRYVTVITDVNDYGEIIEELRVNKGAITLETRRKMMRKAFNRTADYDSAIAMALDKREGNPTIRFSFSQGKELRYGENPHQKAYFFKENNNPYSLFNMKLLGGKPLSFNNIVDIYSAVAGVSDRKRHACSVVKHNNPCGLSEGNDSLSCLKLAWRGDDVSAFGSVIAFNRQVDEKTIEFLELSHPDKTKRKFVEAIVAPSFTKESQVLLKQNKNLRVIELPEFPSEKRKDYKFLSGALLMQETDEELFSEFQFPTKRQFEHWNLALVEFGIHAVKQLKSNAIAVVRYVNEGFFQLLGMGTGQPNRVTSVKLALEKCRENLEKEFTGRMEAFEDFVRKELSHCILVSDAFFPFPDSIDVCAERGIYHVVQPGGSLKDSLVVQRCDEKNVAMAFTGLRHFKH